MKLNEKYLRAMPGPMEGLMTAPLLQALFELARPACFVTPFLRVSEHAFSVREIRRFLRAFPPGPPVLLQLMGTDAEKMAETAKNAAACNVLGINLNFGCPSPQVVRGCAGSGVLKDPALLRRITAACVQAVPDLSVSVKMRCGFSRFAELPALLDAVCAGSPDFLVLHTRTFAEKYQTVPDLPVRREKAAELLAGRLPLVLNGDLCSVAEIKRTAALPGVCGVMAARGLLHDPFLLRRFAGEDGLPETDEGGVQLLAGTLHHSPSGRMRLGGAIGLAKFVFGGDHPLADALKQRAVSGESTLSMPQWEKLVRSFFAEKICNRAFSVYL